MISSTLFDVHFDRLKTALLDAYSIHSVPRWIQENTFLQGMPFSFKDHEYQLKILQDTSREICIRKCSQVGISELSMRRTLALLSIFDGFTTIYTLPTATFAKNFSQTRFAPIIKASPTLRAALSKIVDSSECKQLGDSFLHVKGTIGQTAAISVPADLLVHDELDFSDAAVVSTYQSRLTHSKYKMKLRLSTPTVTGRGIDSEFSKSRRHWNHVKCNHCNHWFVPSYFDHVHIPGYTNDIMQITEENLPTVRYREAGVICPKCGKAPSLQNEHREWVCENPDQNFEQSGYQIQPFDAPNVISIPDLILSVAGYARKADAINFSLGLPAEDAESGLSRAEVQAAFVQGEVPQFAMYFMGMDMGMTCHILIGGMTWDGDLVVVHKERVGLFDVKQRRRDLVAKYNIGLTVVDAMPYTDMVMSFQGEDPNCYAAYYVEDKSTEMVWLKAQEEEPEKGREELRSIEINKSRVMDVVVERMRDGRLKIFECELNETFVKHCIDMRKVKFYDRLEEMRMMWKKSDRGNDHFFHTLVYLYTAAKLRALSRNGISLPSFVSTFKNKMDR